MDVNNTHCCGLRTFLSITLLILLVGIAGCSGIFSDGPGSETTTQKDPSSATSEDFENITTSTSTHSEVERSTPTTPPQNNKTYRYDKFRDVYIGTLMDSNMTILNSSIESEDSRMNLTYQMKDPDDNTTIGLERENVTVVYGMAVEYVLSDDYPRLNESWIPKQVNVTAVTPNGERYETAYTTYDLAIKWINGDLSRNEYILQYYSTIDPGPANPAYEGDQ